MVIAPKTMCVSIPLSKPLTNPSGELSTVINSNISYFFFPQSQHGRIKSWVRESSGVWPAITYALVIWLYWLGSMLCHAPGAVKYQINNYNWQEVHMSVCQVRRLGLWSLCLIPPALTHLCSQQQVGPALGNLWEPCVYSSSYISMGNAVCFPWLDSPRKLVFKYRKQLVFRWRQHIKNQIVVR